MAVSVNMAVYIVYSDSKFRCTGYNGTVLTVWRHLGNRDGRGESKEEKAMYSTDIAFPRFEVNLAFPLTLTIRAALTPASGKNVSQQSWGAS